MDALSEQTDCSSLTERLSAEPAETARRSRWLGLLDRVAPAATAVLISPLHALLSRWLMLVTFKGRNTDFLYTFPVAYVEHDALLLAMVPSAQLRGWWRNFIDPTYASITTRGGRTSARGFAPEPGTPEFARAVELSLANHGFRRRFFGVKLDRDKRLAKEQAEALGQHARVVVFDRAPLAHAATAPAKPPAASEVLVVPEEAPVPRDPCSSETESAELRMAGLIAPLLEELDADDYAPALALAERLGAERCRMWMNEVSDPETQAALEDCAKRGDEIASRVEDAVAGSLRIQESLAAAHPEFGGAYLALFSGMSLGSQLAFQARLQRAVAETWRIIAETSAPHTRGILLECSYLDEKNAAALDVNDPQGS